VAVADAYHAMVHERPYKSSLTHAEALDELRRNAKTQFDPLVVEVFCRLYADGVPPDGLEEVYRLHERARGGLRRLDPRAAAELLGSVTGGTDNGKGHAHEEDAEGDLPPQVAKPQPGRRSRSRRRPIREASG
jgi:hypothetical protein